MSVPIFTDPTPDQLAYLDQPDPSPDLVQELQPGKEWWCYYGTIPANGNRVSACERTRVKCDQHRQFLASTTGLSVESCANQGIAFCKTSKAGAKVVLSCAASMTHCRADGEMMVRAGFGRYSKNCVGVQ
jgi:hypothetical protein